MQRMLRAWDRHLAHPALPRLLAAALRAAGFTEIRAEGHVFATTELDPETYGGMALRIVERYLAGLGDIDREEAKAWAEEQRSNASSAREANTSLPSSSSASPRPAPADRVA